MKINPFKDFAEKIGDGVYHALNWDVNLPDSLIEDLIEEARKNIYRKARLCLHPDPSQILQFTYLAFVSPYKDRIHSHPNRPEIIYPIFGSALHTTFDSKSKLLKSTTLTSEQPVALGTLLETGIQ